MCLRVLRWLINPILALSCLNATEQVNSESNDSGDALAERNIYNFIFKTKTYCHFCLIVQASLI